MKKINFYLLLTVAIITIASCKKNQTFKNETGAVSEDTKNIQTAIDGSVDDANKSVSDNSNLGGRLSSENSIVAFTPCGFVIDTTQRSQGILTLNFDGTTNCDNRVRSGSIKITLVDYASGKRWRDAGAVLKLDYNNYKVKRVSDNKSWMFNGTTTITNIDGGNWVTLLLGISSKLTHKVEGNNLKVTFEDGKTATFNLSRKFTYTFANNILTATGTGEGSYNGKSNLENWGTTRDGDGFTSEVKQEVVWKSTCGPNKPISGQLEIVVDSKDFSFLTTFGVDQSGNVVTSGCPWGLKVEWKYKNKTGQKLYQYN
jgi:hypothetical protein